MSYVIHDVSLRTARAEFDGELLPYAQYLANGLGWSAREGVVVVSAPDASCVLARGSDGAWSIERVHLGDGSGRGPVLAFVTALCARAQGDLDASVRCQFDPWLSRIQDLHLVVDRGVANTDARSFVAVHESSLREVPEAQQLDLFARAAVR